MVTAFIIIMTRVILFLGLLFSVLTVELIEVYQHDVSCYTQGLTFLEPGTLLESCGLYKQSNVRILKYNQLLLEYEKQPSVSLPREVFGEGITQFKGKLYVLTWRQKKVFVFDKDFTNQQELVWKKEGWGLTNNDTHMFISDGSNTIYVVDQSLQVLQEIKVTHDGRLLRNLNELEFYKGALLANVYYQNQIAEIDPETGFAKLHDFRSVVNQEKKSNRISQVLNGIAYDQQNDVLLVTGKFWRHMYRVEI